MRRRGRGEEEVALERCWCVSVNTTFRMVITRVGKRGEALMCVRVSLGDV